MTATKTSAGAGAGASIGRSLASWIPRAVLALAVGGGGVVKLTGDQSMVDMFASIGAGQWLRYVVGALEVAGAIGLLIPALAFAAAGGLVALLIGAAVTNIVALDTSPVLPLAYLAVAAAIAVMHRPLWLRRRGHVLDTAEATP
jgi:putative oxidoreductase